MVAPLVHALENNRWPLVRGHVAWALGMLATEEAILGLERSRTREKDTAVLEEIEISISLANSII